MIAIISGASSGIGREFAYQIDQMGYEEIWLIARRASRLEELETKLKTPVRILALDLLEDESFIKIDKQLRELKPEIDLLVNSAGVGYNDYFIENTLAELETTIDLNIAATTKLIKIALPLMGAGSVIINVASVAGFIPQPRFSAYAASKSYVISLSRSLNRELRNRDIHVTALCPNPVDTEFGDTHTSGPKKYATENLEQLVARALRRCRRTDLITTHPTSKLMLVVSKLIPHSFVMWIEKVFGLY